MQVKVSARHGHLTDEMHKDIEDRAEKLLHYFERVLQIEVTIDLRGEIKKAEVLLNAEHKHDFVAHAEAEDPLTAVKAAIDRMKVQLKQYKEKLHDRRQNPSHGGPDGKRT